MNFIYLNQDKYEFFLLVINNFIVFEYQVLNAI